MEQTSMTALISAFSRWYHTEHNSVKIFEDPIAGQLLSDEEKSRIAQHMSDGIEFFNPSFRGPKEAALRWIVDHQLSPTPLGRAAWAECALQTAVRLGAAQYAIVAAGYDSFAYRQPVWASKLKIFELDHPAMIVDKQARVRRFLDDPPDNLTYIPIDLTREPLFEKLCSREAFDKRKSSFFSLLGISYYLTKESFEALLYDLGKAAVHGSTIVFDYPAHSEQAGERARKQAMMAQNAGEAMMEGYTCEEMERLLSSYGFLLYEHLRPDEITEQYFSAYNRANPENAMAAFENVNFCLAVKRQA